MIDIPKACLEPVEAVEGILREFSCRIAFLRCGIYLSVIVIRAAAIP